MQSPKRKIGRRGFAKKSWSLLQVRMGRGGYIIVDGVPNIGDVHLKNMTTDPTITITNRVVYMLKIIQGGNMALSSAMDAAAKGMMHQIDTGIRKGLKTT
jgi:hypothetical protein